MLCRMFGSDPGIYPLDASDTPPPTMKPKISPMINDSWVSGAKLPLAENHWTIVRPGRKGTD